MAFIEKKDVQRLLQDEKFVNEIINKIVSDPDILDLLAEAIAEEMMLHVLTVKNDCKKLGVPIISVAPDDMFDVIVNEYQESKRVGKAD